MYVSMVYYWSIIVTTVYYCLFHVRLCVCVLRVSARAIEISVPSSDGNTFCPPLHFCGELLSEPRPVDIPTVQRQEFLLVFKTYHGSCT